MKVLQVNGYESPGRRFNGLAITPLLKKQGIDSQHLVWLKDTQDPNVLTLEGKWTRKCNKIVNDIERIFSLQSVLYPHGSQIMRMPAFQKADVLHLHIIHSGFFSLSTLPKMTRLKPTVWTLHDPWALTGHCIHPFDCTRWQIGCGKCPNLGSEFPLRKDNTQYLFNYKRKHYQKSQFEIIVASQWMRTLVEKSPLFQGVKVHQVPFGIDLNFFSIKAAPLAKKRFNIPEDSLVICFRAVDNAFKGVPYIIQALEKIKTDQNICLLTLNHCNLINQFADRFQLVNLEWTNDDELLRDAIAAADIFLMPSLVEAFGMMAIEALACQKPVIVFEGTALPEVTFAPEVGIAVPSRDGETLAQVLQRLIDNPKEREERGIKGRALAERNYSDEDYVKRLAAIYKGVVK